MSDYGVHPSRRLRQLFAEQEFPHQGQDPRSAKVVILGLDANYSPEISEANPFFDQIVEYHEQGVAFWEKHGVHHPFLLDSYPLKKNTGGVPYHRKFSWLKLTPEYSPYISFVELLDVPTTGRTEARRFWELFDIEHARRIDRLIGEEAPRLVMLSRSLLSNYMHKARKTYGVFSWLPHQFHLGPMKKLGATLLYGAPHFSSTSYKKQVFEDLGRHIRSYCNAPDNRRGDRRR